MAGRQMDPDRFQMRDLKRRIDRLEKALERQDLALDALRARLRHHMDCVDKGAR